MAGSAQVSSKKQEVNAWPSRCFVTVDWTGDAVDGSVPDLIIKPQQFGLMGWYLYDAETKPGDPAPTEGYDLAIKDTAGLDLAGGLLVDRSATLPEKLNFGETAHGFPVMRGDLTLSLSDNAVNSAKGTLILTFTAMHLPRPSYWHRTLGGGIATNGPVTIGTMAPGVLQRGQIYGDTSLTIGSYQRLRKWRIALASAMSGYGPVSIAMIGDSTTQGDYSNDSGTGDWKIGSLPSRLARILSARGIPAQSENWFGSLMITHDTRVTIGSAWSNAGVPFANNQWYGASVNSGTNGGNISFTPSTNVDTFVVYYARSNGNGTISWDLNGGSATTVSTNGSPDAIVKLTISATLGTNTLNVKWASGAYVYILGMDAYNSTISPVRIFNLGCSGSKSSDWNKPSSSAFDAYQVLQTIAPKLTTICLGINEWANGGTAPAYQTNMQAIIDYCKLQGDVILIGPTPSAINVAPLSAQGQFINAIYSLAQTNNLSIIDIWSRWVSYEISNPLGLYIEYAHPGKAGHAEQALTVADFLLGK